MTILSFVGLIIKEVLYFGPLTTIHLSFHKQCDPQGCFTGGNDNLVSKRFTLL